MTSRASMACRTFSPICILKLSRMTICSACKLGARICSMESSKMGTSTDPSKMSASLILWSKSEARRVILARLLRGIALYARLPFGDRAWRRVKAMFEPHSSMKTNFPASSDWACSRQAARSSSFCSLATSFSYASSSDVGLHDSS